MAGIVHNYISRNLEVCKPWASGNRENNVSMLCRKVGWDGVPLSYYALCTSLRWIGIILEAVILKGETSKVRIKNFVEKKLSCFQTLVFFFRQTCSFLSLFLSPINFVTLHYLIKKFKEVCKYKTKVSF